MLHLFETREGMEGAGEQKPQERGMYVSHADYMLLLTTDEGNNDDGGKTAATSRRGRRRIGGDDTE